VKAEPTLVPIRQPTDNSIELVRTEIGERIARATASKPLDEQVEIWAGAHLAALVARTRADDEYDEDDWPRSEHREAIASDALGNTAAALRAVEGGLYA